MRLGLRQKLVLGGLAIVVVVSFGFTLLQLALSRMAVEEDLQARAVFFAREVAASIGDRRELQSGARLDRQIRQIKDVRRSVLQLDIMAFGDGDAQHFLVKYRPAGSKPVSGLARETLALLADHDWPGNVRELEHVVERAVALSSSELILPENLPPEVRPAAPPPPEPPARWMTLEELKRWYVDRVLEHTAGNKQRAADILGIDRRTLYRMFERDSEEPAEE